MIRIAISVEAFDAIARTIKNARLYELQQLTDGRLWIWLPKPIARALAKLREPGEDYSRTIIRIAKEEQAL